MGEEVLEGDVAQRGGMSGLKDDGRCDACVECLLPPKSTQTPTISRLQTWEAIFGSWRGQIIALFAREAQEGLGDPRADDVSACIARARVATTVAKEPRHGIERARDERSPEDVL